MSQQTFYMWCVIWGACTLVAIFRDSSVMILPALGMLIWWALSR